MSLLRGGDELPPEMLDMIAKYLEEDKDCFSLALADVVKGFASFYGKERGKHGTISINPSCYFSSSMWDGFFSQHVLAELITTFTSSHCFWRPGAQLCSNILQMVNLTDLSVKGTQLSLPHLARVLQTCQELKTLDFSYMHKKGMENDTSFCTPTVIAAFKKLTSLKISTVVLNAEHHTNDPWAFIIKMLSWCRDCVELTVEITYTGRQMEWVPRFSAPKPEVDTHVREKLLPLLDWMMSLKSLVFIRLGPYHDHFSHSMADVSSSLLTILLDWLISIERMPQSLECMWIQGFSFYPKSHNLIQSIFPSLKSLRLPWFWFAPYQLLSAIEHIGEIDIFNPMAIEHLSNLKSAHGYCFEYDDPGEMTNFIQKHPNLEHLSVDFGRMEMEGLQPLLDGAKKFEKLKSLTCSCRADGVSNLVGVLVVICPKIKSFNLRGGRHYDRHNRPTTLDVLHDRECLSSIRFPHLSSLNLQKFYLGDGYFLQPIISQCPKLEEIYLFGRISKHSKFASNLKLFFQKALKLRKFRLDLDDCYPVTNYILLIFKSLSHCVSHLETVHLECRWYPNSSVLCPGIDHPLWECVIKFALKAERLTSLSLAFNFDDVSVLQHVRKRFEKEVLPIRPGLCFSLDSNSPIEVDPNDTYLHNHDFTFPIHPESPPKF